MPHSSDPLCHALAESQLIRSFDCAALEQVAMAVYLSQIQECYALLKRARSIASVESLKADSKHELIYLQLLRAAESLGYALMACNGLDGKHALQDASPRKRLMEIFNIIDSANPDFFPIACEPSLPGVEWLVRDRSPRRGALTRQGLLDLATKAQWLRFAKNPIGIKPVRLSKLTPEEWMTRFEMLFEAHILKTLQGNLYLVTTNRNGSVNTQVMLKTE